MGEANTALLKDYERIKKASTLEPNVYMYQNIGEMVRYRKNLALQLDSCTNEEMYQVLKNLYDRADYHLKEILALD